MSTIESIVVGALAIALLIWMLPGLKAAMARSKQAPADWPSVFVPIALVVIFVLFLIAMV